MCINLTWVGPYSFGHFSELRRYPYANEPHVYVRVQTFYSRKIAAVGKATNLSSRMNEHLRDFLGRQCYLSDENRIHNYRPAGGAEGEGLAVFDSIDEWLGIAGAEVKRFCFFAAPCDTEKLGYVEAELIDRLWKAAESSGGRIERDNWKKEGKLESGELNLKYQFATPEAKGVLEFIPEAPVPAPEAKRTDSASSIPSAGSGRLYVFGAGDADVPGVRSAPCHLLLLNPSERGVPRMRFQARRAGRVRLCPRISRTEAARRASDNLATGQAAERRQAPRHSWHRVRARHTIRDWEGAEGSCGQRPASTRRFLKECGVPIGCHLYPAVASIRCRPRSRRWRCTTR